MERPKNLNRETDMASEIEKIDGRLRTIEGKTVELEVRTDIFEEYIKECKNSHQSHHEYRRSTDNRLEKSNALLEQILAIIKEYAPALAVLKENVPTLKRSARNYSALDLFREWGGWIISAILSLGAVYHLFF